MPVSMLDWKSAEATCKLFGNHQAPRGNGLSPARPAPNTLTQQGKVRSMSRVGRKAVDVGIRLQLISKNAAEFNGSKTLHEADAIDMLAQITFQVPDPDRFDDFRTAASVWNPMSLYSVLLHPSRCGFLCTTPTQCMGYPSHVPTRKATGLQTSMFQLRKPFHTLQASNTLTKSGWRHPPPHLHSPRCKSSTVPNQCLLDMFPRMSLSSSSESD